MRKPPPEPPTFTFHARWREELVCTAAGGSFVLEATMGGRLAAYLPTEEAWPARAPAWAMALWPVLHSELTAWCVANDAGLVVVADARVDSTPS